MCCCDHLPPFHEPPGLYLLVTAPLDLPANLWHMNSASAIGSSSLEVEMKFLRYLRTRTSLFSLQNVRCRPSAFWRQCAPACQSLPLMWVARGRWLEKLVFWCPPLQ